MGCDIHVYVEALNNDDVWYVVDNDVLDVERSYILFSVLANVRNDMGQMCIALPKGIPDDCGLDIRKEYDHWGGDAHSSSFLTLKELKDCRILNLKTRYIGYVSKEGIEEIDKGGHPAWFRTFAGKDFFPFYREWEFADGCINFLLEELIEKIHKRLLEFDFDIEQINENPDKFRIVFWFDS